MSDKRNVYLDHAATTPVDPRVRAAMLPYLEDEKNFGNPSAIYRLGRESKNAISEARAKIAAVLGCRPEEIIFTGSGTESDNLAVLGVARSYQEKGNHLITSAIEHHAVLRPMEHLAKEEGFEVSYLAVDQYGRVAVKTLERALTEKTVLVSIMFANNEIGTILPIRELAKTIRDWKKARGRGPDEPPFFHTDACQAAGYLDLNVARLGIDLLTINGSKIYGPKGTGVLFKRRGVRLKPLIYGGGQESGLRSGTENVAGIIGLTTALEIASGEREKETVRLIPLRDKLIAGILERIPKVVLNGHPTERLPNNVNVSILDVEGEAVLLYLDEQGIAAATGSACDSASLDPSHVILAIGRPYEFAHASIRFSLGRSTTGEDIDYVLAKLPGVVELLRQVSPVKIELDGAVTGSKTAFVEMGRPHWERSMAKGK
ncbi:aminotransferase class V-fold PLP-dependent enzyme [Patescibacteria group bacterium]|nr:MAG: aminotransferase class V-fold PLP-dependent enzyme [Patescibacteria group bacterium]